MVALIYIEHGEIMSYKEFIMFAYKMFYLNNFFFLGLYDPAKKMHNNVHVKSVILSHKWKAKTLSIGLLQHYDGSHWETKTLDVQVQ